MFQETVRPTVDVHLNFITTQRKPIIDMENIASITPTQDERVMAALAHISALLPMMGVVAPIIIWVTQKGKSKFVAFQSLQALAYQLSMILAWFVGMGCYMFSFF
jgi:uncharacterized Tic20 family protein